MNNSKHKKTSQNSVNNTNQNPTKNEMDAFMNQLGALVNQANKFRDKINSAHFDSSNFKTLSKLLNKELIPLIGKLENIAKKTRDYHNLYLKLFEENQEQDYKIQSQSLYENYQVICAYTATLYKSLAYYRAHIASNEKSLQKFSNGYLQAEKDASKSLALVTEAGLPTQSITLELDHLPRIECIQKESKFLAKLDTPEYKEIHDLFQEALQCSDQTKGIALYQALLPRMQDPYEKFFIYNFYSALLAKNLYFDKTTLVGRQLNQYGLERYHAYINVTFEIVDLLFQFQDKTSPSAMIYAGQIYTALDQASVSMNSLIENPVNIRDLETKAKYLEIMIRSLETCQKLKGHFFFSVSKMQTISLEEFREKHRIYTNLLNLMAERQKTQAKEKLVHEEKEIEYVQNLKTINQEFHIAPNDKPSFKSHSNRNNNNAKIAPSMRARMRQELPEQAEEDETKKPLNYFINTAPIGPLFVYAPGSISILIDETNGESQEEAVLFVEKEREYSAPSEKRMQKTSDSSTEETNPVNVEPNKKPEVNLAAYDYTKKINPILSKPKKEQTVPRDNVNSDEKINKLIAPVFFTNSNPSLLGAFQLKDFIATKCSDKNGYTVVAKNPSEMMHNALSRYSWLQTLLKSHEGVGAYFVAKDAIKILCNDTSALSNAETKEIYLTGLSSSDISLLFGSNLKIIANEPYPRYQITNPELIFLTAIPSIEQLPASSEFAIENIYFDLLKQEGFSQQKQSLIDLDDSCVRFKSKKPMTFSQMFKSYQLCRDLETSRFMLSSEIKEIFEIIKEEHTNDFIPLTFEQANIHTQDLGPEISDLVEMFISIPDKKINSKMCIVGTASIELLKHAKGLKNDTDIVFFGITTEMLRNQLKELNIAYTEQPNAARTLSSIQVVLHGKKFDFTCEANPDKFHANLENRDASATAIAIECYPKKQVHARFKWYMDFANKNITCVSDPSKLFAEDFKRKLRMIRLEYKLKPLRFTLDKEVVSAIKALSENNSEPFATAMQIAKLFDEMGIEETINLLKEYNLLTQIQIKESDLTSINKLMRTIKDDPYKSTYYQLVDDSYEYGLKDTASYYLNAQELCPYNDKEKHYYHILSAKLLMLGGNINFQKKVAQLVASEEIAVHYSHTSQCNYNSNRN